MFDISDYLKKSSKIILSLSKFEKEIKNICEAILKVKKNNNKILIAGNGGSCADAEHFAGELQCTYKKKNRKPISAISLGTMPAAMSAWSNDFGYLTFFKRQVEAHGNKGDLLFLMTTGGGSKNEGPATHSMNLVEAANIAKERGLKVIALNGKSGGELKSLSDISIVVESEATSHIQECHITILHIICEILDEKNF